MQVSTANNVKVYNLSAGKSLPEWISDRKKRTLLKNDTALRQRIELIQDFEMPVASTHIQVTSDKQYILATGVYKPRIRCYDVNQLSMKFERCTDCEVMNFRVLSEDYSKFVLLLANRYLEFHAQYGFYYRTRIPRFGRDLAYHYPSCDLYVAADCPEVYRLNLEQGRFLNSITTKSNCCNVCQFNPVHQLLTIGTEEGTVECWDPRSRTRAGELHLSLSGVEFSEQESFKPAITALKHKDALNFAVGTSSGQVLLYDLRSSQPYLVKDHYYSSPIHSVEFHKEQNLVLSSDHKILKIWNSNDGTPFTAIEPEHSINSLCHLANSGLLFMASENTKMLIYYVPALGPAPKWCSFLDTLTEELEEDPEPTVYEDYKFVTDKELENLGLSHLVGTNLLKAYMHGYFMNMQLYHKAKSIAQPFAYEEYRKEKIKKKIEESRANRVRQKKLPKINRKLAERLIGEVTKTPKPSTTPNVSNPLGDERFSALFTNPDFEVDESSEDFQLLHPVLAHRERRKEKQKNVQQVEEVDNVKEEELEGRPSDVDSSSSDDEETWKEIRRERRNMAASKQQSTTDEVLPGVAPTTAKVEAKIHHSVRAPKQSKNTTLGQRFTREVTTETDQLAHKGSVLGSRELTFKLKKDDGGESERRQQEMKEHRLERRKLRRSASSILPRTKNQAVYWRGKRVK